MNINEVTYSAGTPIDGYGDGYWRIGGRQWSGPVLVLPTGPSVWDGGAEQIVAWADIDVLLLGTGAEISRADPALQKPIEAAGIGVEAMASSQAARTYNVLLGEGRRVACALMPI